MFWHLANAADQLFGQAAHEGTVVWHRLEHKCISKLLVCLDQGGQEFQKKSLRPFLWEGRLAGETCWVYGALTCSLESKSLHRCQMSRMRACCCSCLGLNQHQSTRWATTAYLSRSSLDMDGSSALLLIVFILSTQDLHIVAGRRKRFKISQRLLNL